MEKLVIALTGAVTIGAAVLFLFGVTFDETPPPAKPIPSPPPISSASTVAPSPSVPPQSAEALPQLVCKECPNPAAPTVLEQDGVSVTVSAALVPEHQAEPGVPPIGKVKVKVQSKKPAKVVPRQNYVLLSPENGRDYSVPLSDYRFVTPGGQTRSYATGLDDAAAPDNMEVPVADAWPTVDDTVESELEFQFNLDLVTGRFMVRAPDLMVNGKSYALPPVTFEPKAP